VRQYESSQSLERARVRSVLVAHLRSSLSSRFLTLATVLPDTESVSHKVSRRLLPIVRKLKWSLQRDKLSHSVRTTHTGLVPAAWLSRYGAIVVKDDERTRLAICPGTKAVIKLFEQMALRSQHQSYCCEPFSGLYDWEQLTAVYRII
jgi:hypothetical protein